MGLAPRSNPSQSSRLTPNEIFPKIRGTFLGVPRIGTIVFWGLYWGPPILGNYQMSSL